MKYRPQSIRDLIFTILILTIFTNCKKDNGGKISIPTLSNTSVYNIKKTSASSIWNVSFDGGSPIIETGVCWATKPNPTINDFNVSSSVNGTGTISLSISGLTLNTKYYLRAYATNSFGTGYGDEVSFSTPIYYIGQNYGGGIIFYIDDTGEHGLISALTDQNSSVDQTPWSNNINILTNATSETDGALNTQKIITEQGNFGNYAAKLSKDYRGGGFNDWFLPSKSQLQLLYTGKSVNNLETGIVDSFYASFVGGAFWSSTEVSKDGAIIVNFGNGGQAETYNKTTKNTGKYPYVRSIRAF